MSDSRVAKIQTLYKKTNSAMQEMFNNEKTFLERLHKINLCRPAFGDDDANSDYQALNALAELSSALLSKYPKGPTWLKIDTKKDFSKEVAFEINLEEYSEYLDNITPLLVLSCKLVDKGADNKQKSIENAFLERLKLKFEHGSIDTEQLKMSEAANLLGLGMQRLMRYPMTFNEGVSTASKLEDIVGANDEIARISEAQKQAQKNAEEINLTYKSNPSIHRLIGAAADSTRKLTQPGSPQVKSRTSSRGSGRLFDTKSETVSVKTDIFQGIDNIDDICQMIGVASASYASPELNRGSKPLERDRALKTLASELTERTLQLTLKEPEKEQIHHALFNAIGSQNKDVCQTNFSNALQGIEDAIRQEAGADLMNKEKLSNIKEAVFTSFMQACIKLPPDVQRGVLTDARNNQVFAQSTSQSLGKAPLVGSFLVRKRAESSKVTSQAIKRINKALKELDGGSPTLSRSSHDK